ncbi:TRAP transporter small permease [Acetobacteraceae bacterium H6797]|nr:TRAP transporter small permease [Acetobacteraceae bacterium H6797]
MNTLPLMVIGGATALAVLLALTLFRQAAIRGAILRLDHWLTGVATALASLALALAVGAGLWQVISRFATETPAIWSEALVRTALIWMALFGLAAAIRAGALVSIDVLHRYSRGPFQRALEAASLAGILSLMGVLFWFGWLMAERVKFQEMAGLEVSMSWGYAAIPLGALFCIVGAIAHFLDRRSEELEAAV